MHKKTLKNISTNHTQQQQLYTLHIIHYTVQVLVCYTFAWSIQTDRRSSSSKVQTCVRDTAEPSVAATSDAAVFASYIHTRMRDDMMVATCAFTRTVLLLLVLLVVLATAGTHVVVLRRCPSLHPSVDDIVWWCTRTFFESFYYSGILWSETKQKERF